MAKTANQANQAKMANVAKICHGFGKYSNLVPKGVLWRAEMSLTKIANMTIGKFAQNVMRFNLLITSPFYGDSRSWRHLLNFQIFNNLNTYNTKIMILPYMLNI